MDMQKLTRSGSIGVAVVVLVALGAGGCHHETQAVATTPPPQQQVVQTQPAPLPPTGPTVQPPTEEWVHLPIIVNYPSGGARLDDEARAMMRELHASLVNRTDIIRIRVEGHTDDEGRAEDNERLGLERAQGVVDFATGDLGLPRELFEVQSFGDRAPRSSNSNGADRLLNRRVEFSILVRRQAAP
jgi:outer membrane protein OmpA-like peptidoglycan-associated protein